MTEQEKDRFISKYFRYAITPGLRSGVLPSVTMAQAILESDWGRSWLAKQPYNNFFGIKGKGVLAPTWEIFNGQRVDIVSEFRTYRNPKGSFRDHDKFLRENSRYKIVFAEKTYQGQARALKEAGYATGTNYAQTLINIIEEYRLYRWDWLVKYRFIIVLIIFGILAFTIAVIANNQNKKKE